MGQVIAKLYTVVIGSSSDLSQNLFGSIQEAIDAADFGTTIILSSGDHSGNGSDPIRVKSGIRFVGLNKARITSPIVGEASDIVFDNIIFKNRNNCSLEFVNVKGFLFRNCEFQIDIKGIPISGCNPNVRFGFHLANSSALLQNPIFCIDVEDLDVFIAIGADDCSTYLSLQSPIIRIQYKNICKLETYFYRGVTRSSCIPYFEAFSSSIHYKTDAVKRHVYDGHCCIKEKDRRQCGKRHCDRCDDYSNSRCKLSHECCEKKCKRNKIRPANIRLFRGLDCVNTSIIGTKIYFIEGKGSFNIAAGDSNIYINGLTASTTNPNHWEIGDFNKLLLTSFMSNLKSACEIKECHCIDECSDEHDDCYDSKLPCPQPCSQSCSQPCSQPMPCTPIKPSPPCPCPQPCLQPCPKQQSGSSLLPPCPCPQPCAQPCSKRYSCPCPQPCQQHMMQRPPTMIDNMAALSINSYGPMSIPCPDSAPCGLNSHSRKYSNHEEQKYNNMSSYNYNTAEDSAYYY